MRGIRHLQRNPVRQRAHRILLNSSAFLDAAFWACCETAFFSSLCKSNYLFLPQGPLPHKNICGSVIRFATGGYAHGSVVKNNPVS